MKTFGCLCYPNLRSYAQNKLTLRSDQCVFLGYSALHHGYRCLSLNSGKMHISRHVVFNETTFPFKQNQSLLTKHISDKAPIDTQNLGILGSHPIYAPMPAPSPVQNDLLTQDQVQDLEIIRDDPHDMSTSTTPPVTDNQGISTEPLPHVNDVDDSEFPDLSPSPKKRSLKEIYDQTHPECASKFVFKAGEEQTKALGRPKRTRKPKTFIVVVPKYPLPHCLSVVCTASEPTNFNVASKDPNWIKAMKEELSALSMNNTWSLVPRLPTFHVIGSKWILIFMKHSVPSSNTPLFACYFPWQ